MLLTLSTFSVVGCMEDQPGGPSGSPSGLCAGPQPNLVGPPADAEVYGPGGDMYTTIWGSGPNDIWAGTYDAKMVHYDGLTWSPVIAPQPNAPGVSGIYDLWGTGPDNVWAAVDTPDLIAKDVFRWNGAGWMSADADTGHGILHGSAATDVWLGSRSSARVYHFDGVFWGDFQLPDSSDGDFVNGLWVISPTQAWATVVNGLGESRRSIHRVDDGWQWSPVNSRGVVGAPIIYAASPSDVWAISDNFYHYDGSCWSMVGSFGSSPLRVWGVASNDIWVVGFSNVFHYDGATWTRRALGGSFRDIWSDGPNTWVCGSDGLLQKL